MNIAQKITWILLIIFTLSWVLIIYFAAEQPYFKLFDTDLKGVMISGIIAILTGPSAFITATIGEQMQSGK